MRRRAATSGLYLALVLMTASGCEGSTAYAPAGGTTQPTPPPPGQLSVSPSSLTFTSIGAQSVQTINITTSLSSSTVSIDASGCGSGASAIVTFSTPSGSGTSFTDMVTPVKPGACSATVSSVTGGSATEMVTVSASSGTATIGDYVSPNAASLMITVKTVNGQPPTTAQVPQNPSTVALSTGSGGNCTVAPTGETCTIPIPEPAGTVAYQFDELDSHGNKLATNTVTLQVPASPTNFNVTLNGIVATVSIAGPQLHPSTSFSGPVTVQSFDASGGAIVGPAPFAYPFTIADNDSSPHTSLTLNGNTGKTVATTTPDDVVILNYDGANIPPFTFSVMTVNGPQPISGGGTVTVGP